MRLFFSHSLTTYNTPIENKCLELLRGKYPDHYVINPKDILMDKSISGTTPEDQFRKEMECYFLPRVRECDILAYYKDDSYSPGVDMEIAEATRLGIPIIKLEL